MNLIARQYVDIIGILHQIPKDRLKEAQKLLSTFIEPKQSKNNRKLKGIWKGTEFEKLDDNLEEDLKELRTEMNDSILARKF